jgi:hypothetical protein
MTWFETLTGFPEEYPQQVRENITVDGQTAILNGSNKLFLTLLGGGAFGNEPAWIIGGIERALTLYKDVELDVAIVSYGSPNPYIQQLVSQ